MKKLLSVILAAMILTSAAALAEWFPFGLTADDSFETAREKVKAAVRTDYRETMSYISAQPSNYELFGLKADTILVNRPAGTKWRLTILLNAELTQYSILYGMYADLVANLGEPDSVEPMITSTDFNGVTTQRSPFESDDFVYYAIAHFPSEYKAVFGNVTYRIKESWETGITLGLYFDNPAE